jgi:4-amino-4-deoxy-L-arabinose transferase-like glycosyltransferase
VEAGRRHRAPSAPLIFAAVGLVALLPRLALLFRAPAFIIGDSENYFLPGYLLARGVGFDLDLRRTPAYSVFISLVVGRIGEDLSALLLAQHLLGVGTCLLVAWLGLRLFGPWTGLLAGLAAAGAAPLLVAEHYVMAEALFIPLLTAAVAALCPALSAPGRWPLFLGGALIGVAALARPIGLVLAPALAVALLVQERGLRRAVLRGLPALAGLALVMLPWMTRNAIVHGTFSAEGNAGQTLVGRTMRHDRGFAFENPDDPDPDRQRAREIMRAGRGGFVSPVRERIKRELGLGDAEANRLMRDLALEAVLRQPDYYFAGTLANFGRLVQGIPERSRDHWATRRDERNREEWEGHDAIRHLLGPPTPTQERQYAEADAILNLYQPARLGWPVPILVLVGLVALLRSHRRAAGILIGLTAFGLLLLAAALVAPLARYRYPAEPLLTLLAAGGLATVVALVRSATKTSRG